MIWRINYFRVFLNTSQRMVNLPYLHVWVQEPNHMWQVWLSKGKLRTSMEQELWKIRWGNQLTVPLDVTTARASRSNLSVEALERNKNHVLTLEVLWYRSISRRPSWMGHLVSEKSHGIMSLKKHSYFAINPVHIDGFAAEGSDSSAAMLCAVYIRYLPSEG